MPGDSTTTSQDTKRTTQNMKRAFYLSIHTNKAVVSESMIDTERVGKVEKNARRNCQPRTSSSLRVRWKGAGYSTTHLPVQKKSTQGTRRTSGSL